MVAVRYLGFLKIQNFNGQQGQYASSCQTSWQSAGPLLIYDDFFSIFLPRFAKQYRVHGIQNTKYMWYSCIVIIHVDAHRK